MYRLKYYKEIESQGHTWRIDIRQDVAEEITPLEIGPVLQGLRLVVQGDQADIDTPIVKTSLEMTFVDAPGLDDDRKCGYWEEFFTSSATEYKVQLWKDGAIEWTGYVTPDSFSEDLTYRGSVSIIARDNLGALQDFIYDMEGNADGLVSLKDLLNRGLSKVSFDMTSYIAQGGQVVYPYAMDAEANPNVYDVLFVSGSFKDKSWWEVLESAMYATGMTFRFVGSNRFVFAPIRGLGLGNQTLWQNVPVKPVRFLAFGHRELTPAVKAIREDVSFDIQDNIADTDMPASAYGNASSYTYYDEQMPLHAIVSGGYQTASPTSTLVINPFAYELEYDHRYGKGGEIHDTSTIYIGADKESSADSSRELTFKISLQPGEYSFQFEADKVVSLYDNFTKIGYNDFNARMLRISVKAQFKGSDGTYYTLSDGPGLVVGDLRWVEGNVTSTGVVNYRSTLPPVAYKAPILTIATSGELTITILSPAVTNRANEGATETSVSKGAYVGIKNFEILAHNNNGMPVLEKQRITTQYNEKNNIILTRTPHYGINPSNLVSPKIVSNGMLSQVGDGEYAGLERWQFYTADVPKPLAVLIHQQMLAFYSKPNNVLTGELAIDDPTFNALYEWGGKKHLLVSGTLNMITGRMENAVLREFLRYDHMWETWVENDSFDLEGDATTLYLLAHSAKALTTASIIGLPSWITASVSATETQGLYRITLYVRKNFTGADRSVAFYVDTAQVTISQAAAEGIDINQYLTIEALSDGLVVKFNGKPYQYCIDGDGQWVTLESGASVPAVSAGQYVSIRGAQITSSGTVGNFEITGSCNLLGNCMAILGEGVTSLHASAFSGLFYNQSAIVSVSYGFLPATTLASYCYDHMFTSCANMVQAPSLPATALASNCYAYMFQYCGKLETAPQLNATTLVAGCYNQMFQYCSRLNYIKALTLTALSNTYSYAWVEGVASTGKFVMNQDAQWYDVNIHAIPAGWTVEMDVPV